LIYRHIASFVLALPAHRDAAVPSLSFFGVRLCRTVALRDLQGFGRASRVKTRHETTAPDTIIELISSALRMQFAPMIMQTPLINVACFGGLFDDTMPPRWRT
jgi:hypothetical protein